MTNPRLEVRAISKSFGSVNVLREISLAIMPGEVVSLLGANGAGKSTLVKIISGIYPADAGEVLVDGAPVRLTDPQDAIAVGIRLIPQEISVHPDLSIAENVCLGALPVRQVLGVKVINRAAMRAQTKGLLHRLGHDHDPDRAVGTLGLSQQRVVEIARALAGNARLLIMDEPTAALPEAESETLFAVVEALRRNGVSIIYISHYLNEVFRLSDRIIVLRDGVVAGNVRPRETSHEDVLRAMLGTVSGSLFPERRARAHAKPMLTIEGLHVPNRLRDVSLQVGAGEIMGVFGLLGSGVEQIGRAIFGAEKRAHWRAATLNGRAFPQGDPQASVQAGIGFVAAERKREGLIGIMSVRENTTLPFLDRFVRRLTVNVAAEGQETRRWIDALRVRTRGPEQEIRLLSGGNQQKICLARWLVGDVTLLILEEPTRGVDLGARRELYAQIRSLADRGVAVLVISTDAEEIAGLADRTLVLRDGRIGATLGMEAEAGEMLAAASHATLREGQAA